jgi:hypothetical protein
MRRASVLSLRLDRRILDRRIKPCPAHGDLPEISGYEARMRTASDLPFPRVHRCGEGVAGLFEFIAAETAALALRGAD